MNKKNTAEYIDELIDFYKTAKTCGWDFEYMRKLIVRNLWDIRRRYIKEKETNKEDS